MNLSIKESALLADCLEVGKTEYEMNPGDFIVTEKQLEKFALQIVKKCANIYSTIDNGNLCMGSGDYLVALQRTFSK